MKIMKVLFLLSCCTISLAQSSSVPIQSPKRSDAEELVATVLANNASSPLYGLSFIQKSLNRMGDGLAVGVIQYLGERKTAITSDSTSPEELKMILYMIRSAFAAPNLIESEENRSPKATMVLLSYLSSLPAAGAVKDDLEKTVQFVERTKLSTIGAR